MRILLRSAFGTTSGFGRDGCGLSRALIESGHEVSIDPTVVSVPLPQHVAELMMFPIEGVYDLEIHHGPPSAMKGPSSRSKKSVAWIPYEHSSLQLNDSAVHMMQQYDHVITYIDQTKEALERYHIDNVQTLQGGFDHHFWKPSSEVEGGDKFPSRKAVSDEPFIFLMSGHLDARKNPTLVIDAFRSLLEEHGDRFNAELWIKSTYPIPLDPFSTPQIKEITPAVLNDQMLRRLYWSVDCVVSISRGEAKNLVPLEATMCGTPILVNDIPGHRGWLHPAIQKPVPSVERNNLFFTTEQDVKDGMWNMYRNRRNNFDVARQLAATLPRRMSWSSKVRKLGSLIHIETL